MEFAFLIQFQAIVQVLVGAGWIAAGEHYFGTEGKSRNRVFYRMAGGFVPLYNLSILLYSYSDAGIITSELNNSFVYITLLLYVVAFFVSYIYSIRFMDET